MPEPKVENKPWSAAFISYVVKMSGAGDRFPYSAAHTTYAQKIRENPTAYRFSTINPAYSTPKPGDIVIKSRNNNILRYTNDRWLGDSHGDIVVDGEMVIGGNVGNKVTKAPLIPSNYFVILRPNDQRLADLMVQFAGIEFRIWERNQWTSENQEGARQRVQRYWQSVGQNIIPPTNSEDGTGTIPPTPSTAISPNITSLESFHPRIQRELTRRRLSANTAAVYMPFVKLTSLSRVLEKHLESGGEALFPSLGIHGQNIVEYDDIYSPVGNRSRIGYAIRKDGTSVAVLVESSATETTDQAKVPIPGIISAKAERSTAGPMGVRGGLMKMDLTIRAYSKGQLDALLVYFLRPATRLVLEFGRISSNSEEEFNFYDWKKPLHEIIGSLGSNNSAETVAGDFPRLLINREFQKEFAETYVYASSGNYELFLGYVVKFNIKYTKDNIYEIDLTLHSVQQYEVPTVHTAVSSTCKDSINDCDVMDIRDYFNEDAAWKNNTFTALMTRYQNDGTWGSDIVSMKDEDINLTAANNNEANEYYVTWRFFIEQIMSNPDYGIASMLKGNTRLTELSLPRITRELTEKERADGGGKLIANEVGYHAALRSTDPSVMIIYNPKAQPSDPSADARTIAVAYQAINQAAPTGGEAIVIPQNNILKKITNSNYKFSEVRADTNNTGIATLTNGVWINTAAIKRAFSSTDTISAGLNSLLSMMNGATEGYWNLQLYSTDSGMYVIDMGLSKTPKIVEKFSTKDDWIEPSTDVTALNEITNYATGSNNNEAKYLYMFNRKTKFIQDGELGSDLIDLNVEFNMPQVIAVQAIANIGGSAQKSLLQSIDIDELKNISLLNDLYKTCDDSGICKENKCGDAELNAAINSAIADWVNAANSGAANVDELRQKWVRLRAERTVKLNKNLVNLINNNKQVGTGLVLIEKNPAAMMRSMNLDSTEDLSSGRTTIRPHAFNSSNLTKTVADVTLPGIGGIELFQAFLVDRAPSILERGFYVVTKVNHEFESTSGWVTKIQGRFRFRPPPKDENSREVTNPCE